MSVKNENRKLVRSLPKMVLLNSEGNILTAYKKNDKFLIMDEYYEIFNSLDSDELYINCFSIILYIFYAVLYPNNKLYHLYLKSKHMEILFLLVLFCLLFYLLCGENNKDNTPKNDAFQ